MEPETQSVPTDLELAFTDPKEREIAARLLPKLADSANRQAEANKAKELKRTVDELVAQNKDTITAHLEKLTKSATPPTQEELTRLVSQEYADVDIKLRAGGIDKSFTIRELPMDIEKRVIKALQKTIKDRVQEFGRVDWGEDKSLINQIIKIMDMVPGTIDTLAEIAAVCLDPYQEDSKINGDWVRANVSMTRLAGIIITQLEVNRYRDFLSLTGRFFPGMLGT